MKKNTNLSEKYLSQTKRKQTTFAASSPELTPPPCPPPLNAQSRSCFVIISSSPSSSAHLSERLVLHPLFSADPPRCPHARIGVWLLSRDPRPYLAQPFPLSTTESLVRNCIHISPNTDSCLSKRVSPSPTCIFIPVHVYPILI